MNEAVVVYSRWYPRIWLGELRKRAKTSVKMAGDPALNLSEERSVVRDITSEVTISDVCCVHIVRVNGYMCVGGL
jgi:hypothetical protein